MGKIVVWCPEIFAASVEKLRRKVAFTTFMAFFEDHLPRTIKTSPELLVFDINRTSLSW